MKESLISVIIPVYKVEQYLDRCMSGLLNQTYKNLEIILVDDGSPDRCGDMCDRYAAQDKRIMVIHKENGGLSDARNAALDVMQGDYVAFADSDDYFSDFYIENLYKVSNKREVMKIQDEFLRVFRTKDLQQLERFHRQLDIIAEGYRAQAVYHNA